MDKRVSMPRSQSARVSTIFTATCTSQLLATNNLLKDWAEGTFSHMGCHNRNHAEDGLMMPFYLQKGHTEIHKADRQKKGNSPAWSHSCLIQSTRGDSSQTKYCHHKTSNLVSHLASREKCFPTVWEAAIKLPYPHNLEDCVANTAPLHRAEAI